MDQFGQARGFGAGREASTVSTAISRYSRIVVLKTGHADIGGLEGGDPEQLLDAVLNLALVGGGGRTLFHQQLLGHALIDAGVRRAEPGRR